MRGDILIISQEHRKAAGQVYQLLREPVAGHTGKYVITVAGESGAGKSETAMALAETLEQEGYPTLVIQQDDFFVYPPKTNAAMRVKTGGKVGPHEVRIELLNEIVRSLKDGQKMITKPLVVFAEDLITTETIDTGSYRVVIIEGTYTTLLDQTDCKIFIDRNLEDTRSDRLKRNRERQDDFLERILLTEHRIISGHKTMADIIITREFNAIKNILANE